MGAPLYPARGVVGRNDETFNDVLYQHLRRTPWWMISIGAHAIMILVLWNMSFSTAEREDDLQKLQARIVEEGLPEEAYAWYLDLRRYGTFPHSGFGLGLERTVAWITGRHHIRELIPFPRTMNRLYP